MADDVLTIFARAICDRRSKGESAGQCEFPVCRGKTFQCDGDEADARAALAALAAAGGFVGLWRTDMENAKDGSWVLTAARGFPVPSILRYDERLGWCDELFNTKHGTNLGQAKVQLAEPTAWAALPAPPGERK